MSVGRNVCFVLHSHGEYRNAAWDNVFFFEFWTHAATKLCKRALETKPQEPLILLIAYSDP